MIAPAHWAQGSSVTYRVARSSRSSPTLWRAPWRANSSACAVGSLRSSVSLCDSASTSPSAITTAPTGTSSRTEAALASRRAASIPARSPGDGVPLRTGHFWHCRRASLQSLESQHVSLPFDSDGVALVEVALQQLERDRVLQQPLDHPLQRPGSIHRIVTFCRNERLGRGRHIQREVPLRQHTVQPLQLQVDDVHQILATELTEHDNIVYPIEELRPEMIPELVPHPLLDPLPSLRILPAGIHDVLTSDI